MKSTDMGKLLGALVFFLSAGGLVGPSAVADAAPPQTITRARFEAWFKEISNWGRWGKDDELGTLNLITPEKRKAAAALVRDGVSVSLALDLNTTADALNTNPFEQELTVGEFGGHAVAADRYSVRYHGFAHSHMDGLTHFSHKGKLYNGVSVDVFEKGGARKLGVQNAKSGIFTRGVLVDIPWLRGVEFLEPGTAITSEDLEAWEAKTTVTIGSGDVLLIRTGRWERIRQKGQWNFLEKAAGSHASLSHWLKARDVAVIGSDGVSDVIPLGRGGPGQSPARAGAGEPGYAAARQSRSGPAGPRSAAAEPLDVSVRRLAAPRAGRHWISAEPPRDFLSGDSGRGYTACRGAVGLPAGPWLSTPGRTFP